MRPTLSAVSRTPSSATQPVNVRSLSPARAETPSRSHTPSRLVSRAPLTPQSSSSQRSRTPTALGQSPRLLSARTPNRSKVSTPVTARRVSPKSFKESDVSMVKDGDTRLHEESEILAAVTESSDSFKFTVQTDTVQETQTDFAKPSSPKNSPKNSPKVFSDITTPPGLINSDLFGDLLKETDIVNSASNSPTATKTTLPQRKAKQTINSQAKTKKTKKTIKEKQEKKETIALSLWIDGVPYEHGVICTFCTIRLAIRHCSACNDFYCATCDATNHAAKKRKDHVRSDISPLTLFEAASIITRAFRLAKHLKLLQAKCREKFKRYFDKKTLSHYYVNTVYRTNNVSWRKPYCLRKQELFPFLEPDAAAARMQAMYHGWKARIRAKAYLLEYYRKVFDRTNGRFYYAFNGPSKIIPPSSWKKPRLCGRPSYPYDIPIISTPDISALLIQRKWRAILVRESWRTLARLTFQKIWDPLRGKWNYYDPDKQLLLTEPLKLMRGQPWDPNDVEEWPKERVFVFLRRIGLKHFVNPMNQYGVSGKTLLLFGAEDYANMGITNRVEIKKVEVEIAKIYKYVKKQRATEELIQKRERIRKAKLFAASATLIQKNYRMHLARKNLYHMKLSIALRKKLELFNALTEKSGIWYTELPNIPSRLYKGDGILLTADDLISVETPNSLPTLSPKKAITHAISRLPPAQRSESSDSMYALKLPVLPVKRFGRKRDHMSTRGWGRRGPNGEWIDASSLSSSAQESNMLLNHPTRIFTEKLKISGYDKRRFQKFLGLPVDPYEFSNVAENVIKEPEIML